MKVMKIVTAAHSNLTNNETIEGDILDENSNTTYSFCDDRSAETTKIYNCASASGSLVLVLKLLKAGNSSVSICHREVFTPLNYID